MDAAQERLADAAGRLDAWIEGQGFRGWDPFDALNSPLLERLTFGRRRLGQVWVQALKRSPVNLRSRLGVAKGYNPKGMGLFLGSYLYKWQASGARQHLERVHFFADWLREHVSPGYSGACWGYNFDWPNRGFFAPAGTPTVVNTAFIALAFLDADRALGGGSRRDESAGGGAPGGEGLAVARSGCDFVLEDLNRLCPNSDTLCFSYTPLDERYIHNANVMGAWLLARVHARTGEGHLREEALAATRYTVRCQRADGSWPYGEGPADGWVDSFHTGFVLVALQGVARCLETAEFDDALAAGYRFWKERMFLPDATPKYYAHRVYPIDAHSVAQAILTYLVFSEHDPEAEAWARRVARWGVDHMQDRDGHFHYQIYRHYRIRIPYMRWSQAWMQRALTELLYGERAA